MNKYVVARQRRATDGTVCCIARSNNAIDHIIYFFVCFCIQIAI